MHIFFTEMQTSLLLIKTARNVKLINIMRWILCEWIDKFNHFNTHFLSLSLSFALHSYLFLR